jgi:Domain of unknown function (DUF4375)
MGDAAVLAEKIRTWGSNWSEGSTLEVVDHVHDLVSAAKWDFLILDRVQRSLAAAFRVRMVEEQVQNGGYYQYFWNGYEPVADATVRDLELMGAAGLAGVQRDAVAAFNVVADQLNALRKLPHPPYGVAGPYQEGLAVEDFGAQNAAWDPEYDRQPILDLVGKWLAARRDAVSDAVLATRGLPGAV